MDAVLEIGTLHPGGYAYERGDRYHYSLKYGEGGEGSTLNEEGLKHIQAKYGVMYLGGESEKFKVKI